MGALSPWHWAIILLVLVLLFGSKKMPEAARGLGRSLRIFKSEMSEMQNDGKNSAAEPTPQPPAPPTQLPPVQPTHSATPPPPQQQPNDHADPRSA